MNKIVILLMIALMSAVSSTPASAKSGKNPVQNAMPKNIIVKQTTRFSDGRTLVIYYKKADSQCELYSPCNANDYDIADASKIKSTSFEVTDRVEGRLYRKASVAEVMEIVKKLVNQYF